MRINIALCADEKFAMPCGVCITSIFEWNSNHNVHVYILTDGFSSKSTKTIDALQNRYHQEITIINVDKGIFSELKVSEQFPLSIYYRYLIPNLISESKVLYLDSDIIVKGDLSELFSTNIIGVAFAAVEDQRSDDVTIANRLGINGPYFNSGVMLINSDYWRTAGMLMELIGFIKENPHKCVFPDQDALNVIAENKFILLSPKFNVQSEHYYPIENQFLRKEKWSCIQAALRDPIIIHYTAEKPWYTHCHHPMTNEFLSIYRKSLWKNKPLLHKFSFAQRMALWAIWLLKLSFKLG